MLFGLDVFPDVELGPVRQREHPHRLALADAGVEQPPEFGALIARIPGVGGGSMRKDALLGAALLLVATRSAERRVVAPDIERLAKRLGLHHLGMDLRPGRDRRHASFDPVLIDVDDEFDPKPARCLVAEGDHLPELPGRVDVKQRERRLGGMKRLHRHVQHDARVFADRIKHNRIAHFCDNLTHYVD